MKRLALCLILLIGFSVYGKAQNYKEVVHLKNGSVVKGVIIEQIPNESLKIKTADGSLFVFQLSEVSKITKEELYTGDIYKTRRDARNTLRGYKGFLDIGYTFDVGNTDDYRTDYNMGRLEISTSHGYQFNNYFFVGAGVAINYYPDAEAYSVPVFANFRANFINNKVTPFADIKTGYSAGDLEGAYASLAVGVRFALANKAALNLRLEYTAQGYETYYRQYSYYSYYESEVTNGIGLKIGVEF